METPAKSRNCWGLDGDPVPLNKNYQTRRIWCWCLLGWALHCEQDCGDEEPYTLLKSCTARIEDGGGIKKTVVHCEGSMVSTGEGVLSRCSGKPILWVFGK
ncbi:hypothetical protein CsSME_00040015 [Camellia sinensis var. sinensis]